MKLNIFIIASILFITTGINAQVFINIDTCRNMALEQSEEIFIAKKQYEKALHEKKVQRSNYFPKINANGTYLYSDYEETISIKDTYLPTVNFNSQTGELEPNLAIDQDGNPIFDNSGNPVFNSYAMLPATSVAHNLKNSIYATVALEQPIYMGGKILAANKMAEIGADLYNLNTTEQRQAIILETDKIYWTYLSVIEQVKVVEKYLSLLDSLIIMVNNGVDAGLTHRNELLKVRVKQNEARDQYNEAINGKELLRMSLCRMIGVDLLSNLTVIDSTIEINIPVLDPVDSSFISNRMDYKMLTKQIEINKANEALVRSDFLPKIGVRFSYDYLKTIEFDGSMGSFDLGNGYLFDGSYPSFMATISIPIFQWGEGKNKIKQAKIDTEIANAEIEKSKKLMFLELNQTKLMLNQAYNRNLTAINNLNYAKENMDISKTNYGAGMELLTDYLEAQAQWQNAFSDFVKSKANCKIAETIYLKSIGKL